MYSNGTIEVAMGQERASLTREQSLQVLGALSTALTAQSRAAPGNQRMHSLEARGAEVNVVMPGPRVQVQFQMIDAGILGFDLSPELTAELHDFLGKALRALPNLPGDQRRH